MRPAHMTRRFPICAIALLELLLAAGCTTLPPGTGLPKPPSSAVAPSVETALGKAFLPLAKSHGEDSAFRMLSAGIDGLTARVEMIDAAQRSLDLQYYIFRSDKSGNLIAQALLRAADRGVRVRVITDDGESVSGDERLLSLAAKPGIEIRLFNPLRYRGHLKLVRGADWLFEEGRLDYRMHNKLMVADNAVAIIGGRNIGDQYFQIDPESQFGDDDVVVAGPIVQRLSAVFDQFGIATSRFRRSQSTSGTPPARRCRPFWPCWQRTAIRSASSTPQARRAPQSSRSPRALPAPTARRVRTASLSWISFLDVRRSSGRR